MLQNYTWRRSLCSVCGFFYVQHFKSYQNIAIYVLCVYFGSYLCCHSITYHRIIGKLVNSPLQRRPTFKDHAIFLDEQQTEKWVRSQEKKKISLSLNSLGNSPVGYRLLFWLFFGELDDSAPSAVEPDTRGFLFPFFFIKLNKYLRSGLLVGCSICCISKFCGGLLVGDKETLQSLQNDWFTVMKISHSMGTYK